jgi:hypothetical protein
MIEVVIITPERKEVTNRVAVTRERPNQPGKHFYTTTEYDLSDPSLRAEVLKTALPPREPTYLELNLTPDQWNKVLKKMNEPSGSCWCESCPKVRALRPAIT